MKFFLRYWSEMFTGALRSLHPALYLVVPLTWVMVYLPRIRENVLYPVFGAFIGILVFFAFEIVFSLFVVSKHYKVYSALDKYGPSPEYLKVYERERITNKPFNLAYAVDYAGIFEQIGQPAEAIRYLNTLNVPENAHPAVRVSYFYIYVISALKIGNLSIAEDMWERNMPMIQKVQSDFGYSVNSHLIYLALITTDLYAARATGNPERLQRAYEQTLSFMNSKHHKRYSQKNCDFDIVLLYELKAMGKTDEFNALLPKVRAKVESYKPLFTGTKRITVEDFNKAANGELPL